METSSSDINAFLVKWDLSPYGLATYLGLAPETVQRWRRGQVAIAHPRMLWLALRGIEADFANRGVHAAP